MKIIIKTAILCFLLFSCKETTKEESKTSTKIKVPVPVEQKKDSVSAKQEIPNYLKNKFKIKFPGLTISILGIDMNFRDEYNPDHDLYQRTKKDTAYFDMYPGEWFYEKSFVIAEPEFDEIELYGQFEIKVAIATDRDIEVPVCIMEDWKGYTSKWTQYKVSKKDLKFPIIQENIEKPIDFNIDELKLAVAKNCEPEWASEIRNIQSLNKLRTSFFITKYVFKIKARDSKTDKVIEKFIVFYTPTSC